MGVWVKARVQGQVGARAGANGCADEGEWVQG